LLQVEEKLFMTVFVVLKTIHPAYIEYNVTQSVC
jgi:hypothetical protein